MTTDILHAFYTYTKLPSPLLSLGISPFQNEERGSLTLQ